MESQKIVEYLKQLLKPYGVVYDGDANKWDSIVERADYTPNEYMRHSVDYQHEYMKCFSDEMLDLSVIFINEKNEDIGCWPLTLRKYNNRWIFGTNQGPVLPPFFVGIVPEKTRKKYIRLCMGCIEELYSFINSCNADVLDVWKSRYLILPEMRENELNWYKACMEKEAKANVQTDLYMDLTLSNEELFHQLRKKFRQYINKGKNIWDITIYNYVSDEIWDNYRFMHKKVSGKVTRSKESWDVQKETVNSNHGFYVESSDNGTFVGGAYFEYSKDECLSAVGVYDRDLFDLPVSHVINWEAICYMKKLGLKKYLFGRRFYPGDIDQPNNKELQIAYFKEGFAKEYVTRLILENRIQHQ